MLWNVYSLFTFIMQRRRLCYHKYTRHPKDSKNNKIDSLRITIRNTKMNTSDIFRSSTYDNGFDRTYILEEAEACNYIIEVEDIDGEKNGGFFETQTKTVEILMSDYGNCNDLLVVHPYANKKINFIMINK